MRPRIAITTGEPAGIGPEISCAALASEDGADLGADVTLIGDRALLEARGADSDTLQRTKYLPIALRADVRAGQLDPANAAYVLATLDRAIAGALSGEFDAIVTAPVQKSVINDAGMPFSGHTEYLAEKSGVKTVVMLLAGDTPSGPLRVALATTHLPLADVSRALSVEKIVSLLEVLIAELKRNFGLDAPRIAVTGLNPHAGEGGHLGREELDVIIPALDLVRATGERVEGPFPADTVFVPAVASRYDAVLAMYHDQGLPVLKYATFGHGVNVTLGLPFVRTSVDHGTALDLAGSGRADAGSMRAALKMAIELAKQRARR
jgi:4-hydroxythreonine-4-phosphate dehydrogenase